MPLCAECQPVRTVSPHVFRGDHQRRQVHLHAAVLLGDGHRGQAQFHRLAQDGERDARLFSRIGVDSRSTSLLSRIFDQRPTARCFFVEVLWV